MSTESPLAGDPEPLNDPDPFTDDDGVLYDEEVTAQHGILGFTLRELLIVGVWAVIFATSFFPVGWSPALWSAGIAWILPLGVPTAAVFLIVLRRFSPEGIRRVGSLGIDQFASVAFSVAAVWWAQLLWEYFSSALLTGVYLTIWVPWVQLIGMLGLVVLTVFAPLIPELRDDFHGRLVTLAHRNANPVRPVIARPRAEKPAPAEQASPTIIDPELSDEHTTDEFGHLGLGDRRSSSSHASSGDLGTQPGFGAEIGLGTTVGVDDSDYVPAYSRSSRGAFDAEEEQGAVAADAVDEIEAADHSYGAGPAVADDHTEVIEDLDTTTPRGVSVISGATAEEPADAAPAASSQPFWALAPTERDVFDERGEPLFRIGPTAWALVVEDRGGAYVIRHDDGRIGYLHDIVDITKG